jgi:hypothetical protein
MATGGTVFIDHRRDDGLPDIRRSLRMSYPNSLPKVVPIISLQVGLDYERL